MFGGIGVDIAEFCRGDTSGREIKSCEQLVHCFFCRGIASSLFCDGTCNNSGPKYVDAGMLPGTVGESGKAGGYCEDMWLLDVR